MILAQAIATINVDATTALEALAGITGAWVLKILQEVHRDRRDRLAERDRLAVLTRIADTNETLVRGQAEQNGKLAAVTLLNQAHHEDLIRTLTTTCRFVLPNNQRKHHEPPDAEQHSNGR